jgi:hypothetical protein
VVYDDLFTTVLNAEHGGVLELENFREERWRTLIQSGVQRTGNVREYDHDGRLIPLPTLNDEWLTPAEIRLRDASRRFQRARRARERHVAPRRATQNNMNNDPQNINSVPEPVSAPEGDGRGESSTGSRQDSQPPIDEIVFDDSRVDFDEDWDDEIDNDLAPVIC